ncbi:MAG: PQQ-binding-like beta-propeller repeat protein [Clostridia bacterium]|nr:PQQ-binding-like beta-propeller repeat protein [Clostridia bacterium]
MNAHPFKSKTGVRGPALILAAILLLGAVLLPACSTSDNGTTTPTGVTQTPTSQAPTETPSGDTGTETPTGGDTKTTTPAPSTQTPPDDEITGFYSKKEGTVFCSPSSICADSGKIFVSDATNNAVYRFSADGTSEKSAYFDGTVSKIAVSGEKVYALVGEYGGKLFELDRDLNVTRSVTVGHTPSDLVISGNDVFVCNRFSNTVSVVDLEKGRVTAAIEVSREPYCMAAAGGVLYVGSRLQDESALNATLSSKIVKIDMASKAVTGSIALQDGVTNLRTMVSSPDGSQIVVTHTVARYTYPTTQLDRGWVNTNGFTVIDTETGEKVAYLLDDIESGAANPWGAAISADGKTLFVSAAGTGELIRVDLAKIKDMNYVVTSGRNDRVPSLDKIIDRIDYLSGVKKRVKLSGAGARSLCLDGDKVYVAEYFSGTVAAVDAKTMKEAGGFAVGQQPEETAARKGERLWFDANYCYQTWESCSSCHPDARPDALNWDEGGDGWGTPKNTKSMIFSMRTPPVLTTGVMESAEANVMGTVREAFRSTLSDEDVECMNCYLRALLPVDSPYLAHDAGYTPEALRGRELFESKGCSVCHPAPLYTDLQFHKSPYLGADGSLEDRAFITPTLVEIWRSAPYTYCGKETSVREVVKKFVRDAITDAELSDLTAFVLSIGTVGEYYGVGEVFSEKDGETILCRLEPGAEIKYITLFKQIPSASGVEDPVITVTLKDGAGAGIAEKVFTPGQLIYDVEYKYELGFKIPDNAAAGTTLTVTVTDAAGNRLASVYSLKYSG